MNKIKSLWDEQRGLFLLIAILLIIVLILLILNPTWVLYLVVAAIITVVLWLAMDSFLKARRNKRQATLDERIAAKEGTDDRKREWLSWTQELRKHGINRYELPFYLLVGEPQSGKSILLQNSGLHFPLGQSKLSGPGGTRGCDWWFTEEAVVLDLAGRLFTHEGGQSDAKEWEAFLSLLAGFRPLSPANGILLVIPCDSLLQDSAEKSLEKATRIRESLTTLVDKLEAQLPIYLVLTKADKIFGFAESVHRLDSERRRQMFGWSRSAEDFEKPFNLPEFREAFRRIRTRAHLIRAGAMASAQVPAALPEIDRLFAFPEELGSLQEPLESYVQCIFSETALLNRLFFRGLYLTSGLQQGAPIAQACADLFGSSSEADARNLEGLFTKQRAYFIRDFIQRRVFAERGLVRPTSGRVQRSRKLAILGYGSAAAIAIIGALWFAYSTISSGSPAAFTDYQIAIDSSTTYLQEEPAERDLRELLSTLGAVQGAIRSDLPSVDSAFSNNTSDFERLHTRLCEADLNRLVRAAAEKALALGANLKGESYAFTELEALSYQADFLLGSLPQEEGGTATGFSLGNEQDLAWIEQILRWDPQLLDVLDETRDSAGRVTAKGLLASAIETHLELGGELLPSKASNSASLRRMGDGLLALYDRFLRGANFERRKLPAMEETGSLERLIILQRIDNAISSSAMVLNDPGAAGQAGRLAPCDALIDSEQQLKGALQALVSFKDKYSVIDRAQFGEQYDRATERLERICNELELDLPASWREFRTFSEGVFRPRPGTKLLGRWVESDDGHNFRGKIPPIHAAPRFVRNITSKLFAGLGSAGSNALQGKGGGEQASKNNLGEVDLLTEAEIIALIGIKTEEIDERLRLCADDFLRPETIPNPRRLLELVSTRWAQENEQGSGGGFMPQLVNQLQPGYVGLYESELGDDDTLANKLGLEFNTATNALRFSLNLQLADHLVGMQTLLSDMDPESKLFADWLSLLESQLNNMLKRTSTQVMEAGLAECAIAKDESFIKILAMASQSDGISQQALGILQPYLEKRRAGLIDRWDGEPRFDEVMGELHDHLLLERELGQAGYLNTERQAALSLWLSSSVDPLLSEAVGQFGGVIREYWNSKASLAEIPQTNLADVAKVVVRRLKDSAPGEFIAPLVSDAPDFGVMRTHFEQATKVFEGGALASSGQFPRTNAALKEFESIDIQTSITKLRTLLGDDALSSVKRLAKELAQKRRFSNTELAGGYMELGAELRGLDTEIAGDGANAFFEQTLRDFHGALAAKLSELYSTEFDKNVLIKRNRTLDSELFVVGGKTGMGQVSLTDLQALLNSTRDLYAEFGREQVPADGGEDYRLRPFEPGSARDQWDGFLFSLVRFFNTSSVADLEAFDFNYQLLPSRSSSFWKKRGALKNNKNLTYWWPDGKSANFDVGADKTPPEIIWNFDTRDDLYIAFNSGVSAPKDSDGKSLRLIGSFAPLALAWHYGVRSDLEPNSYLISIQLDEKVVGRETIFIDMRVPDAFPDLPESELPRGN